MKKTSCIIAAILTAVVLLAVSCGSTGSSSGGKAGAAAASKERAVPSRVPDFVKQAIINAPEDALIGIGTAKMATLSQSKTIAETRARAEISRQMNSMIQDMVRDYTASSEVDTSAALSFQENITVALSKSTLVGSKTIAIDEGPDGSLWVVMQLGKTNAVQEIVNAQESAKKLAPAAMASFNAEDRMNAAFDKAYSQEVQIGDK